MKRLTALLLALTLLFAAVPAFALGGEISYEEIVAAALNLRQTAHGDFMDIKGIPMDIQGMARDWTAGIDDTPDLVVRMDVNDSAVVKEYRAMFRAEHPMVSYEAQSTGVGEIISYSMVYSAYESNDPEKAYDRMADVNTALNHNVLYASPDAEDGAVLYVVLYEDALPILLLTNIENGATSLTTYILSSDELSKCGSYAQVAFWFMRWGCPMTGAEIRPE